MLHVVISRNVPFEALRELIGEDLSISQANSLLDLRSPGFPDIIVSDSGQDLSAIFELARLHPESIVMLFGQFDAQTLTSAINCGVFGVTSEEAELVRRLKVAAQKLKERTENARETSFLRMQMNRSRTLLRDKFVNDMLFGSNSSSINVQHDLEYFKIAMDRFVLIAFEVDPLAAIEHTLTEEDIDTLLFIVVNQIENQLEEREIEGIVTVRSRKIYAILPCDAPDEEVKRDMLDLASEIGSAMEDFGRFTVSAGISRVYEGIGNLRIARSEGDRCLAARFHIGDNCIIHIDDLDPRTRSDIIEIDIEPFKRAVSSGIDILAAAKNLTEQFVNISDPMTVKNIAVEAATAGVLTYCESFGTLQELFDAPVLPLERILNAPTSENVTAALMDIAYRIDSAVRRKLSSNSSRAIENAKAYIEAHYADDITLFNAADSVHMSQWYFSKLFRKETGSTFSDFLIDLRIRKAKELIRSDPGMKNYEIAEKVGFSDPRYFGQLFKKITGMTPGDYRRIPAEADSARRSMPVNVSSAQQPNQVKPPKVKQRVKPVPTFKTAEGAEQTPGAQPPEHMNRISAAMIDQLVESGRTKDVKQIIKVALNEGMTPQNIISAMISGMERVGDSYRDGLIFVPEMLIAARAMSAGLDILRPMLVDNKSSYLGRVVIGTVSGDLHDIGKNLVAMMLKGSGFEVIDLGVNVTEDQFVAAIRMHRPDILGLSALLTTTMPSIGATIAAVKSANLRNSVKIMIGGAPLSEDCVALYGADGYSAEAAAAVTLAKELMSKKQ